MEEWGSVEAIIPFFYITSVLDTVYRQTSRQKSENNT